MQYTDYWIFAVVFIPDYSVSIAELLMVSQKAVNKVANFLTNLYPLSLPPMFQSKSLQLGKSE